MNAAFRRSVQVRLSAEKPLRWFCGLNLLATTEQEQATCSVRGFKFATRLGERGKVRRLQYPFVDENP